MVMKKFTYLYIALFLYTTLNAQTDHTSNFQRVRIAFKAPEGYKRHLLLGFTKDNSATDGLDNGYDGLNNESLPDDLNWMISNQRFIIQGVGAFHVSKRYPLGLFMSNSGPIEIMLTDLENFEKPINVFIYDAWENKYHLINDESYKITMALGVYKNRFFMTFSNETQRALSDKDIAMNNVTIKYIKNSKSLKINTKGLPLDLQLYDLQGRLIGKHHLDGKNNVHDIPFSYLNNQVILTVLKSENKTLSKQFLIN